MSVMQYEAIGKIPKPHSGLSDPFELNVVKVTERNLYPRWFRKIERAEGLPTWWDHYGRIGKNYLVVEPYDGRLSADVLQDLLDFCKRHDLKFWIKAGSPWYPLLTILFIIWPSSLPAPDEDGAE